MILDSCLIVGTTFYLQHLNAKNPNLLFLAKNAAMLQPPFSQQTQKKWIKISYADVKDYPLSTEFSRILTTVLSLIIYTCLRLLIPYSTYTMTVSLIICGILCYIWKIGIHVLSLTNYNNKFLVIGCGGINLIMFFLWAIGHHFDGIYDRGITIAMENWAKHLTIVTSSTIYLSETLFMTSVFVFNFLITLSLLPSIIKFGGWYAQSLKKILQIETQKEKKQEKTEQQLQILKSVIRRLNWYLFFSMGVIILSHRYFVTLLSQTVIDLIRAFLLGFSGYLLGSKIKIGIESNASSSVQSWEKYSKTKQQAQKKKFRKEIAQFIYCMWYYLFQFTVRILLPALLFCLVINCKYLMNDTSIYSPQHAQCAVDTDQLNILRNLFTCSTKEQLFNINGALIQQEYNNVQSKIAVYGVFTKEILIQFAQLLFWYASVTLQAATLIYVLFLRKVIFIL